MLSVQENNGRRAALPRRRIDTNPTLKI